uniref:CCDC50_N domain-containing protein n=1 Tax=Caenorhabditis tropicalis TaxID=1561998 RepID=A0A1I7URW8_9PELO
MNQHDIRAESRDRSRSPRGDNQEEDRDNNPNQGRHQQQQQSRLRYREQRLARRNRNRLEMNPPSSERQVHQNPTVAPSSVKEEQAQRDRSRSPRGDHQDDRHDDNDQHRPQERQQSRLQNGQEVDNQSPSQESELRQQIRQMLRNAVREGEQRRLLARRNQNRLDINPPSSERQVHENPTVTMNEHDIREESRNRSRSPRGYSQEDRHNNHDQRRYQPRQQSRLQNGQDVDNQCFFSVNPPSSERHVHQNSTGKSFYCICCVAFQCIAFFLCV